MEFSRKFKILVINILNILVTFQSTSINEELAIEYSRGVKYLDNLLWTKDGASEIECANFCIEDVLCAIFTVTDNSGKFLSFVLNFL